jgi:hypothetical protein
VVEARLPAGSLCLSSLASHERRAALLSSPGSKARMSCSDNHIGSNSKTGTICETSCTSTEESGHHRMEDYGRKRGRFIQLTMHAYNALSLKFTLGASVIRTI